MPSLVSCIGTRTLRHSFVMAPTESHTTVSCAVSRPAFRRKNKDSRVHIFEDKCRLEVHRVPRALATASLLLYESHAKFLKGEIVHEKEAECSQEQAEVGIS